MIILKQGESSKNQDDGVLAIHRRRVLSHPQLLHYNQWRCNHGRSSTFYHSVTIGVLRSGVPVIGDNVAIGTGAIILGGIHVGNNVNIGAGAVVVEDVPDDSTFVGPKVRIIPRS